jgi:ribosome-binding protein aMBF1 (putative translation factor)
MSKVQFIKTNGGEELAVLPKAEYERLAALATDEDVGTARLVRKARAAVASRQEVLLPKSVVDQLAAGDHHPVRILREWREMTQAMLAQAMETTQGYLSDIESSKRKGTVDFYKRAARALGVPIDLLLPIAVSEEEADPVSFAKRKSVVQKMRRDRGFA